MATRSKAGRIVSLVTAAVAAAVPLAAQGQSASVAGAGEQRKVALKYRMQRNWHGPEDKATPRPSSARTASSDQQPVPLEQRIRRNWHGPEDTAAPRGAAVSTHARDLKQVPLKYRMQRNWHQPGD